MLFQTVASMVLLAASQVAAQNPRPYKPALTKMSLMPLDGMSLMRRSTNGYQPEQTICGDGNTCAEACGSGYTDCASTDSSTHCYSPDKGQTCCSDGTGNSCDSGYYCTHDTSSQTWCCPDSMDLVECAAAYSVTGGLETPVATTSTPTPTSTSTTSSVITTSSVSIFSTPTTTSTPTPHSHHHKHKTTSSTPAAKTKTKVESKTTTVSCASSGLSTAWSGSNTTISVPALTSPTVSVPVTVAQTTVAGVPTVTAASGAAATGVSALLLVAAGFVALF